MPLKQGLDYFPISTDFFQELPTAVMDAKLGTKGITCYLKLLCHIYKQGYYIELHPLATEVLAALLQVSSQLLTDVVRICLKSGVFDSGLWQKYGILTSSQIQQIYLDATRRRKQQQIQDKFNLIHNLQTNSELQNAYILAAKEKKKKYTLPQTPSKGASESANLICFEPAVRDNSALRTAKQARPEKPVEAARPAGVFDAVAFCGWWNSNSGMRPVGALTAAQKALIEQIIGEIGKERFFAILQWASRQGFYNGTAPRSTRKGLGYLLKEDNWQQLVGECEEAQRLMRRRREAFFGDKPEKPDVPDMPERPERPDTPESPERPDMPEVPGEQYSSESFTALYERCLKNVPADSPLLGLRKGRG